MVFIFHGFFIIYHLLYSFLSRFSWKKNIPSWFPFGPQPLPHPTTLEERPSQAVALTELRRVFEMFDRNKDGRITMCELSDSLENIGIFIYEKDLVAMINIIDVNGDGCIDIEELGVLYQTITKEKDEEEDMREAFDVFDKNGDGFITAEELQSVLSGLKQGRMAEDCRKMIRKVDADGDRMVNYNEFKEMMKGGGFVALNEAGRENRG